MVVATGWARERRRRVATARRVATCRGGNVIRPLSCREIARHVTRARAQLVARAHLVARVDAAGARDRGLKVIVAGAGGAAHLPGMTASMTPLPVFGVPIESAALKGMHSLLSIVQMPKGVPVGPLAIRLAGAVNAALLAAAVLALGDQRIAAALDDWRARQTDQVADTPTDNA